MAMPTLPSNMVDMLWPYFLNNEYGFYSFFNPLIAVSLCDTGQKPVWTAHWPTVAQPTPKGLDDIGAKGITFKDPKRDTQG